MSNSMMGPVMGLVELWLRRYRSRDQGAGPSVNDRRRPAVVITGASEGIGLQLAHRFAAAGQTVVMIARSAMPLQAAAVVVGKRHGSAAVALPLDVTAAGACGTIEAALAEHGLYVDVLVNNAGVGLCGAYAASDEAALVRLINLNVVAVSVLTRHFLPAMLNRGRGGILTIASLAGFAPGPYQAAYYASKAYEIALSRAIAHEVRGQGVRVSVVVPGPVDTRFHERMGAEASLYRHVVRGKSAEAVARSAYRGFRFGLGVVYPGLLTPVAALAMRIMPGIIMSAIIGLLLRPRSK